MLFKLDGDKRKYIETDRNKWKYIETDRNRQFLSLSISNNNQLETTSLEEAFFQINAEKT
ncbi:hypothetical protein DMA11_23445 [Marinilabiliaceae bacterium JC017]|nr:hypothetical protein DMA11_23445 [Marinilabiliaceae bacterium JC017]